MEIIGILIIAAGILIALLNHYVKRKFQSYKELRHELGRILLLGLEILVAGDIISTVVIEPSMDKVLSLAMIVLIRTFLSLSIEVEIDGRFPWQQKKS